MLHQNMSAIQYNINVEYNVYKFSLYAIHTRYKIFSLIIVYIQIKNACMFQYKL